MQIISAEQVSEYLCVAQDVASSGGLWDSHVHATEVIFRGRQLEQKDPVPADGHLSLPSPRAGMIRELGDDDLCCVDPMLQNRSSEISFAAIYNQVGPTTLKAHMNLSHVTRALLLPVAPPVGEVDDQLRFLTYLREQVPGVSVGYSLPRSVAPDKIGDAVGEAIREHQVCVVKLHPNLSRIDPCSADDSERIKALLQACDDYRLPMIVHGGRSPILGSGEASQFGTLENLTAVDWSYTRTTVVIAHGGVYGRSRMEAVERDLPILQRMLSKWPNLVVDTSGLSSQVLAAILRSIDIDRIIFGSDALYVPMWRSVAIALHAIQMTGGPLYEVFSRIAQINPRARLKLH